MTKNKRNKETILIKLTNLPKGLEETELYKWFTQFGPVLSVACKRSKKTGSPSEIAYVLMKSSDVAEVICQKIPTYILFDKVIRFTPKKMMLGQAFSLLKALQKDKNADYSKHLAKVYSDIVRVNKASRKLDTNESSLLLYIFNDDKDVLVKAGFLPDFQPLTGLKL